MVQKNEHPCTISTPINCYQWVFVKDLFQVEKNKIYRQYFGTSTFSVDEACYLLHCQYRIDKERCFHTGYRAMGNVYVYQWAPDVFLGYGNNSITPSPLPQE
jgi:hypothetical protein